MKKKIDRFDEYMKHIGLNDNKATTSLSLSVGTLGKSRKEGRDISDKVIEKILNFYTDLAPIWLLTGEGDMLKSTSDAPPTKEGIKYYPDVVATMGDVQFLEDPNESYDLISIPNKFNGCVAINAFGDSMSPRILSGNIILIQKWEERYIEWGKIYLVRTRHGNRMIKYLMPCDNDEDCVLACSENKKYPPVKIYNEDIIYPLYILRGGVWDMD